MAMVQEVESARFAGIPASAVANNFKIHIAKFKDMCRIDSGMFKKEYTLEFEDRGSYLYARLNGKDSFVDSLSYWHQIADRVKDLGFHRLLVHENLEGEVSEGEIYDLVIDLKDTDLLSVKIAFYDENQDEAALNAFAQLVAVNRGGNVKIFHSLGTAQRWIEQVG
ncbi:hypothetical protein [Pontiella sulfatireligans]|uniref:Uncharacterized protein n=1 Tax=Pontiella sulfatireligans TaxID=2750658 RepID=A0A6C2ULR1_9BACT|nr:hypothetical protein [Pontiella sulfatireligans]VGO20244.1 hypothetical protein SCARR_02305 [Pontiella sulfatireligans]